MSPAQLFQHIAQAVPSFAPVLSEHLHDNGELLPHVLMGDLLCFVGARIEQRGQTAIEVAEILNTLECEVSGDNADTANAIAVSFLENLEAEPFFSTLYARLGPKLRAAHTHIAWPASGRTM
ncbi:MAG: hypothetical protein ABL989_09835 [Gammaproteobacteria bacterium]